MNAIRYAGPGYCLPGYHGFAPLDGCSPFQYLPDFLGGDQSPLADTGAQSPDLFFPNRLPHVFGPERPCGALKRTDRINTATVILQETAMRLKLFEEVFSILSFYETF
jgi:hypothetical protein